MGMDKVYLGVALCQIGKRKTVMKKQAILLIAAACIIVSATNGVDMLGGPRSVAAI